MTPRNWSCGGLPEAQTEARAARPAAQCGGRGSGPVRPVQAHLLIVQVSNGGRYVKVEVDPNQVPVGSDGAIYVFKRNEKGAYERREPGYTPWLLKLGVLRKKKFFAR